MARNRLLLALLALLACATALAQTPTEPVTVTWVAPTAYTSGTPIPAGTAIEYWVYIGTAGPGSENESAPVNSTGVTALAYTTTATYAVGTEVCALVKDTVDDVTSTYSPEACTTITAPTQTPNPPTGTGITTAVSP